MKLQQGILPALIIGGVTTLAALFVSAGRRGGSKGRRGAAARVMVRVTENGRKYHRAECPLLHGATRTIPVAEALASYEPCKACHLPGGE